MADLTPPDLTLTDAPETPAPSFTDVLKSTLAKSESGGSGGYLAQGPAVASYGGERALGKYQFMPERLRDLGIDTDSQSFLSNPALQEKAMDLHINDLTKRAEQQGLITPGTSDAEKAGILWAGHIGGAGTMSQAYNAYKTGGINSLADVGPSDGSNTTGMYFAKGMRQYQKAISGDVSVDQPSLGSTPGMLDTANDTAAGRLPVSGMDYIKSSVADSFNNTNSGHYDAVRDQISEVEALLQKKYNDPTLVADSASGDGLASRLRQSVSSLNPNSLNSLGNTYEDYINRVKSLHPDADLPSYASLESKAGQAILAQRAALADQGTQVGILPKLAGVLAGGVGWALDPYNTATAAAGVAAAGAVLPGLAAGGILGSSVAAGLGVTAGQAAVQPLVQSQNEALGLPHGFKEGAEEALGAGVGTAVGGVVMGALGKAITGGFSGLLSRVNKGEVPLVIRAAEDAGAIPKGTSDVIQSIPHVPEGQEGNSSQAFQVRYAKTYQDVEMGKSATTLPQGVTGVQTEFGETPLERTITSSLNDEHFADTATVSSYMQNLRDTVAKSGNATADELAATPLPDHELPNVVEQYSINQRKAIDLQNEQFGTPDAAFKAYQDDLQSRLQTWGETPEEQSFNLSDRASTLEADMDKAAGQLDADKWEDAHGYDANPVDASDRARRHVERRALNNQIQLDNIKELQSALEKPLQGPEEVPATVTQPDQLKAMQGTLKAQYDDVKGYLQDTINLGDQAKTFIPTELDRTGMQIEAYKSHSAELKASMSEELDHFTAAGIRNHMELLKQENTRLAALQKSQKDYLQYTKRQQDELSKTSDFLDSTMNKVKNMDEYSDATPLDQANLIMRQIDRNRMSDETNLPIAVDNEGRAISHADFTNQTAEKFSTLKALDDCIGRNS